MKIDCIYFDDEMSLIQEVKQTRDQLKNHNIELDNLAFGFIMRGRNLGSLPENWDHIMEHIDCSEVDWKEFIFDGTLFLIGLSYKL